MDIRSLKKVLKTAGQIFCDIKYDFNAGYKSIILETVGCWDNQRVFRDPKIFLYSIITKSQKSFNFKLYKLYKYENTEIFY